jgi:hypothetical protein
VKCQPTETSEGGMAWEKQQPPAYRFENISHWLSAFHIFVSIYSEKYPLATLFLELLCGAPLTGKGNAFIF